MQSWVEGANEPHGFGIDHLPFGAFVTHQGHTRLCVRLGEWIIDLYACSANSPLEGLTRELEEALSQPTLHALMQLGPNAWAHLRRILQAALATTADGFTRTRIDGCLQLLAGQQIVLPIVPRGYTDFYASIHHARRVGELFRPDQPLLPNYTHIPIAYNGRASSIIPSNTPITRPSGQQRPITAEAPPTFAPTNALDYELELAYLIGEGNALGAPIHINKAREQLFGITLLNDWSARDVQAWEYQPLGPFLGKSFATSISPWVTPLAALEPFRVTPVQHPSLPYLHSPEDRQHGALDIQLTVTLTTESSRAANLAPFSISSSNPRDLYWTPAQMVAHHTSNGCNLQPGDLLATGTISGPESGQTRIAAGCLLELTQNGQHPITLPNGETRAWLHDGDEVTLTARCEREGFAPIQLGDCTGRIAAASSPAR